VLAVGNDGPEDESGGDRAAPHALKIRDATGRPSKRGEPR
jgi:hypothetical protein